MDRYGFLGRVRVRVADLWTEKRPAKRSGSMPGIEALESRETPAIMSVPGGSGFPFSSIVKLYITFPDNQQYVASGATVDSFHVLASGEDVYSSADGGFATSVEVIPELNKKSEPFGTAYATYLRTFQSFVNYNQGNPGSTASNINDMSLLTLNSRIGSNTGWMAFGYNNDDSTFSSGYIFNMLGYPLTRVFSGKQMYLSDGKIAGLTGDGLAIAFKQSQIPAFAGESGAPVFGYYPGQNPDHVIYGDMVGFGSTNFATLITQPVFSALESWIAADTPPSPHFVLGTIGATVGGVGSAAHAPAGDAADAPDAGSIAPIAGPSTSTVRVSGGVGQQSSRENSLQVGAESAKTSNASTLRKSLAGSDSTRQAISIRPAHAGMTHLGTPHALIGQRGR